MSVSPYYPRWITRKDGATVIVPNRDQHMAQSGKYVTEEGIEMDAPPDTVDAHAPAVEDALGLFKE